MVTTEEQRKLTLKLINTDPQDAKVFALQLVATEPLQSRNYVLLALCFGALNDFEKALSTLQLANKRLGSGFLWRQEYLSVVRAYETPYRFTNQLVEFVCDTSIGSNERQKMFSIGSDYIDAETLAFKSKHISTSLAAIDQPFLVRLFQFLDAKKQQDEVLDCLNNFQPSESLDTTSLRLLSEIYAKYHSATEALEITSKLESQKRTDAEKLADQLQKAKLWHLNCNVKKSLEILDELIDEYPQHAEPYRIKSQTLHYSDSFEIEAIRDATLLFGRLVKDQKRKSREKSRHRKNRLPKIGFVSAHFQTHPVGYMTAGFFCECQKFSELADVKVFALKHHDDFVAKTIQNCGVDYHNLDGLSDSEAERKIRGINLDLVVDLDGLSAGNRISLLLKKLAPIMVKWVGGLNGSMWLPEYDYLISDRYQTPEASLQDYSEEVIILEESYVTYTPPPFKIDVLEPPHTVNKFITFGCLNKATKISPTCMATWAKILNRIPESRLFLKDKAYEDALAIEEVKHLAREVGIDPQRIIFKGRSGIKAHIEAIRETDICLDPMPYSGGLSTLEAILVGVPVITLPGRLLAHRHSASHLTVIGHSELVAQSPEDYVEKAIKLAKDPDRILAYRHLLRNDLYQSPLLNHHAFCADLLNKLVDLIR